jgi:hypothetical protein
VLDHVSAQGADFDGASLFRCSLLGADLSSARFARTILTKTSFGDADLRNADSTEARFDRTRLGGAKLVGIVASGASGTIAPVAPSAGLLDDRAFQPGDLGAGLRRARSAPPGTPLICQAVRLAARRSHHSGRRFGSGRSRCGRPPTRSPPHPGWSGRSTPG